MLFVSSSNNSSSWTLRVFLFALAIVAAHAAADGNDSVVDQLKDGARIQVNYKDEGVWYPATYRGPDRKGRPGYISVEYDDYPNVLGALKTGVRLPRPIGVEVSGAGDERVNGWYLRKEGTEWPPSGFLSGWSVEARKSRGTDHNVGRHDWYEHQDGYSKKGVCKDGRAYINLAGEGKCYINTYEPHTSAYVAKLSGADPPASGWEVYNTHHPGVPKKSPAPTLKVVYPSEAGASSDNDE